MQILNPLNALHKSILMKKLLDALPQWKHFPKTNANQNYKPVQDAISNPKPNVTILVRSLKVKAGQ